MVQIAIQFKMILCVVTVFLCISSAFADNLVITTDKGKVRGSTLKSYTGKEVDVWYGIPFADKPLGQLRFKPPVPAKRWNDVLETTSLPNACVQTVDTFFGDFAGAAMWVPNTKISEDCLYLNVVVPKPRPHNATVMVWIYGGGFYSGSSSLDLYDMKTLAAEENVIVVSMQYRVASLGFLYFGNSEVPGNVGLLDQVMALQWVHDNIIAFGGNPDQVTIFGESAGSGSVSHHLLSSLSKNLFKYAIMQSGTVLSHWAIQHSEKAVERSLLLAKELRCPHSRKHLPEVIDCLRKANATEMVYAEQSIPLDGLIDFAFLPVVDQNFVVEKPTKKIFKKDFKHTNILLGANENEGYYFLMYALPHLYKNEENVTLTYDQFLDGINQLRMGETELEMQAIIYEYSNWANLNDGEMNREALEKRLGDQFFTSGTTAFADVFAETGNEVFVYHYKHNSRAHYWPTWSGVLHADEVAFIFGEPMNLDRGYSPDEVDFSKQMMRYWSNFAKSGNPNKPLPVLGCEWPVYTTDKRAYISFKAKLCNSRVGGLRPRQTAFWKKYLPKLKSHRANTE